MLDLSQASGVVSCIFIHAIKTQWVESGSEKTGFVYRAANGRTAADLLRKSAGCLLCMDCQRAQYSQALRVLRAGVVELSLLRRARLLRHVPEI